MRKWAWQKGQARTRRRGNRAYPQIILREADCLLFARSFPSLRSCAVHPVGNPTGGNPRSSAAQCTYSVLRAVAWPRAAGMEPLRAFSNKMLRGKRGGKGALRNGGEET